MRTPVSRISDLWRPGYSYEVFPFVEIRSTQPNPLISHYGERLVIESNFECENGFIETDRDFLTESREIIFEKLDIPDANKYFSENERLAFGLSMILRDSIPKSRPDSFFQIKRRWQDFRASEIIDQMNGLDMEATSIAMLLGGLIDSDLPGFYRLVKKQDFLNWGLTKHSLVSVDKNTSIPEPESALLAEKKPLSPSNQYQTFGVWAWLNSGPKECRFFVDFEFETMQKSLVCYSRSSWGDKLQLGRYAPARGTLEYRVLLEVEKADFDADLFIRQLAIWSGEYSQFCCSILQLPSPIFLEDEWRDIFSEADTPTSSKEKLEIFSQYSYLLTESKYSEIPLDFFLSACMGGPSRIVTESKNSEAVTRLIEDFFLILRRRLTFTGSRKLDNRVANLLYHAYPQMKLKDDERYLQAVRFTNLISTAEKLQILASLVSSASPSDFFIELKAIMDRYDNGLLSALNSEMKTLLLRTKRSTSEAYAKSVSQMYDGLYNTYGAER